MADHPSSSFHPRCLGRTLQQALTLRRPVRAQIGVAGLVAYRGDHTGAARDFCAGFHLNGGRTWDQGETNRWNRLSVRNVRNFSWRTEVDFRSKAFARDGRVHATRSDAPRRVRLARGDPDHLFRQNHVLEREPSGTPGLENEPAARLTADAAPTLAGIDAGTGSP